MSVGAIIIFRGIKETFRKPAAAGNARKLSQFIIDAATAPESVGAEVDRLTEGASREDLIELRSYLDKLLREGRFTGGEELRRRGRRSTPSTPSSTSDAGAAPAHAPQVSA